MERQPESAPLGAFVQKAPHGAFDRIELVSGMGDPRSGRLCVMSLVAWLAGEGHTDRPDCASAVIRAFSIPINDHMPQAERQRLKVFAPRIAGTADGFDPQRITLLRQVALNEILPRISIRHRTANRPVIGFVARFWVRLRRRELLSRVERLLDDGGQGGAGRGIALASALAQLLALRARGARDTAEAAWCWNMALRLLDQMCDVGAPERDGPPLRSDRLAAIDGRSRG